MNKKQRAKLATIIRKVEALQQELKDPTSEPAYRISRAKTFLIVALALAEAEQENKNR